MVHCPGVIMWVPTGQGMQIALATSFENVPKGHDLHLVDPGMSA